MSTQYSAEAQGSAAVGSAEARASPMASWAPIITAHHVSDEGAPGSALPSTREEEDLLTERFATANQNARTENKMF